MRPVKLMSPAREPSSSRRPPAIRRLSISVTMTTAAAETLKSVRQTLCVATIPVDHRGNKTVRGRQRRRGNRHCRSLQESTAFTSWFYLLVTSSPCSLTTPDTWPFWPRPSRKASTMRTLRPDPSPESKCRPLQTFFLSLLWIISSSHLPHPRLQVLLGFPRSLQPRGRAPVPGAGVHLSEGPPVSPEELWQHRVAATVGPILVVLPGES